MKIVLIGAGRLATGLGRALAAAGHEIVAVYSRTQQSAETLAALVGGWPTNQLAALPAESDAYVLAVKDSALREVVSAVTKGRESQVFLHTAGSMPMTVFEGMARHYGVLYPMQSFSKERTVDFGAVPTFIEASDNLAGMVIRRLAESVSRRVYELSSEERRYLHLAAVFACNFANHCYALSAEVLERHGLPFDVMLPLIDETSRKVHELHPLDAQTGPAVRYDENVIGMQARLLDDDPDMKDLYLRLSQNIHRKANEYDQLRLKEDTGHRV